MSINTVVLVLSLVEKMEEDETSKVVYKEKERYTSENFGLQNCWHVKRPCLFERNGKVVPSSLQSNISLRHDLQAEKDTPRSKISRQKIQGHRFEL